MTPTAQRNTRQSGAGLKILSAGSTLYGLRPCAEMFERERGIPIQVATDHGHHIHQAALRGEADADVVLLPADMIAALAAAGVAPRLRVSPTAGRRSLSAPCASARPCARTRRCRTCPRWRRYATRSSPPTRCC